MGKKLDLTGFKSGKLTVLHENGRDQRGQVLWSCRCECGNYIDAPGSWLKRGLKKSCGCMHHLPEGEANFNKLYGVYKFSAKQRGYEFELSKSEFRDLTKGQCHYCGADPSNSFKQKHSNGSYIYNGIDRKDNSIGYVKDNVVTCCERCNMTKKAMSYNEFIQFIKSVYEHLNLQK